jgi:hypothetical protein
MPGARGSHRGAADSGTADSYAAALSGEAPAGASGARLPGLVAQESSVRDTRRAQKKEEPPGKICFLFMLLIVF